MAAFVTPALLGAGAAAMSAPILIHLLARRKFKRVRWAAMDFLLNAERRNKRRIRLEEWILLALRCLAVFLIGMLVARPFVSPANIASAFGGSKRTERVFLIDDTFSMEYRADSVAIFDRAKEAVRRVIGSIRQQTPDDTVTILRVSAVDKPVVSGAFLDETQTEQILERVAAMQPTQRSMELSEVFGALSKALEEDSDIVNVALYIMSDFQAADWNMRGTGSGGAESPAVSLQRWVTGERGLHVFLVKLGEQDAVNTAITELRLDTGQVVAGTTGNVHATIAHFAAQPRGEVTLELTVGDRLESTKPIPSIGERQQVSVDMETEFIRAGDETVRLALPEDNLSVDNRRYLSAPVVGAIRVLIVNGEPAGDEFNDEVALLATALRPEGEVFSGMEVVVVDEAGLEDANLSAFHLVILANVYRVVEPVIAPLERFVRGGGGVIIFLGDQVDPDLFNATLFRGGEGLSPVELIEIARPAEVAHLVITDRLHPALRGVGGDDDPLGLGQVPFRAFFRSNPWDPEKHGEGETATGSRPARIVARFDDTDQTPAIIERSLGGGRVLLLTTTADKEWNLWADHPTFLPIMLELVNYVAHRGRSGKSQFVGTPIELAHDASRFEADVLVRTPAYPNEPEAPLTATPLGDGERLVLRWDRTETSGFYSFVMRKREGGEEVRQVAVNVDPRESDLEGARDVELRRVLSGLRVEIIDGLDDLTSRSQEARTELWRIVLIFGALVLMAEQGLAFLWGRRR